MGVLDKVFGGSAGKLVESVGGVLDNLTTTKDEKAEGENEGIRVASNSSKAEAGISPA